MSNDQPQKYEQIPDGQFKVLAKEIPSTVTIHLSEMDKCLFARLLTAYGIRVDVAGDTFVHLYSKGLKKVYNEEFPDDKVY